MAGFRLAAAGGADYLELDVQRTADDVLVVIHDDDLARTTDGFGLVAADDRRRTRDPRRRLVVRAGVRCGARPAAGDVLAWAADDPDVAGLALLVEAKGAGTGDPDRPSDHGITGRATFGDLLVLRDRVARRPGRGAELAHDADRGSRPTGRRSGRGRACMRRHDGQRPVVVARAVGCRPAARRRAPGRGRHRGHPRRHRDMRQTRARCRRFERPWTCRRRARPVWRGRTDPRCA